MVCFMGSLRVRVMVIISILAVLACCILPAQSQAWSVDVWTTESSFNPPTSTVTIYYNTDSAVDSSRIDIANSGGSIVRSYSYYYTTAGTHTVIWDGKNTGGSIVPNGRYRITYSATDDLEFGETITANYYIYVDTMPPTTSCSLAGTGGTGSPPTYTSTVTVTLTATDSGSGAANTNSRIDSGSFAPYSGPFTVSATGTHTVYYYSTDWAGFIETTQSKTFVINIDTTPPTTSCSLSGTGGPDVYTSAVTVTLSATDTGGSGVQTINYAYVNTTYGWSIYLPYSGPFTISDDGTYSITYFSSDNAGNIETHNEKIITINKVPSVTPPTVDDDPVTTINVAGNMGSGNTYTGPVVVTLTAVDTGSGVKKTVYSLDGGNTWNMYSSPFTIGNEGTTTVRYYSEDNGGHIEDWKTQSITIHSGQGTESPTPTSPPVSPTPTVTMGPNGNSLEVRINAVPSPVEKGQESTVTVEVWGKTDSGRVRVEGANVIVESPDGGTVAPMSGTTDANGACTFTFSAPDTGNYTLSAIASKQGYPEASGQKVILVKENNCLMVILPFVFIIALILLLALVALFLLLRMARVKLEPRKTLILADGKSTALVVVSLVNGLGRPAKLKKNVDVAMGTSAGTIKDVTIPAGSSSAEATLTSSREFGPVEITANYGNKTAKASVDFKYDSASLDVTAVPQEIPADGTSTSTITVKVKNEAGEYIVPLKEQIVELHATLGRIQSPIKIPAKAQSVNAVLTAGETGGEALITALMGNVKGETKVTLKGAAKRFCMHCGSTMTMEASKCPKCGQIPPSGVDVKHCTTCNAIVPEAAKYCDKCGARQPEKAVQPPAQEPKKE
jgi:ribosomal protein L40E/predicted RNA-binding protein with TRAM domain